MTGYGTIHIIIRGTQEDLAKIKILLPTAPAPQSDIDWFLSHWKLRILRAVPVGVKRDGLFEVIMDDYWDDTKGPAQILLYLGEKLPSLFISADCKINHFGFGKNIQFSIRKEQNRESWISKTLKWPIKDAFLLLGLEY